jgi:hypothetical protein
MDDLLNLYANLDNPNFSNQPAPLKKFKSLNFYLKIKIKRNLCKM